jgi:hypothetical protein
VTSRRLVKVPALAELALPAGLAGVTARWLTAALHDSGVLAGAEVVALDAQVVGADRGFTGVVARLRPTYHPIRERAPSSMVVKLPTAERGALSSYRIAAPADAAAARRHFQRGAAEVWFYRDLAASLGRGVPSPLYAAVEESTQRVVLLLPDLAAAVPGDVLAGCSPEEVGAVLRSVAPLHAAWWARPPGDTPRWLPRLLAEPVARQDRYRARVDAVLDRHGDLLPAPVRDALRRLRTTLAAALTRLGAAPATVVHADLHLDNVMFDPRPGAPHAVILDWQGVAGGPAAVDVAAFIVGSLSPADRRAAEDDLLRGYHAMLRAGGVVGYSWQRLRQDYRLAVLRHVAGVIGWLATADRGSVDGRERALLDAILGDGRLAAALADHDAT